MLHRTCRFESREAELKSLQIRVAELGTEADSAQESAQRKADALRAQLTAKQVELVVSNNNLTVTQARRNFQQVPDSS